ncbi:response regulator [Rhodohalobacter sp.]|uniref:response regulator n=1 Tax=Rhodohalobacter sp. TaxID=1974210 RepID=UPI002ACED0A5|nr:response regulator [Rhodohalobacter sp.]MDZ7755812.1 response regulator [Rhodohalobacter sp.]
MKRNKEYPPIQSKLSIILAEDDPDDRLLFKEAIEELPVSVQLKMFKNGEELMTWLTGKTNKMPDALFLDLNMPRKNGFATLSDIKKNANLEDLPVFIFSTATKNEMIKQVYKDAAHYYIRKPVQFNDLKKLIYKSLKLIADQNTALPGKESFMLTTD